MKKVLILANHSIVIYNFRIELIQRLVRDGYEVHLSAPYDELIDEIIKEKCIYHDIELERRKTNPFKDYKLLKSYKKLIEETKPDMIFSYTIKPNIYGGIAAARAGIPFIPNVTGLGSAVENNNLLSKFVVLLYKVAFRKAQTVFFQNTENMNFFKEKKIAIGKHKLLPGSGVNLERFSLLDYPREDETNVVFISRIMKEKGVDEYLEAAERIKEEYHNVHFHICGFCEESYQDRLKQMQDAHIIQYHGMVKDVRSVLKDMHCVVLPSYHEGMSNVLLEGAATGRPLITSNVPGCRETLENNKGGYLVDVQDADDLAKKIEQFIMLSYEEKKSMGIAAREYVVKHFDRQIVVDAYMNELNV